jgi:hypothetical protein
MKPQKRDLNILIQEVGNETVVYDQERHRAHRLNPTAALIFRHCDGRHSFADLAGIVSRQMGLAEAGNVVRLGLEELREADLLASRETELQAPVTVSRREMISQLKYAGVFGLALPAITSIATPAPLAAVFATPSPSPSPSPTPSPSKPTGKVYVPKDNPNPSYPPLPAAGTDVDGYTACDGTCSSPPTLNGTIISCPASSCGPSGQNCRCRLFVAPATFSGSWKKKRDNFNNPIDQDPNYDRNNAYACICVK